jgi:hypothetical protein
MKSFCLILTLSFKYNASHSSFWNKDKILNIIKSVKLAELLYKNKSVFKCSGQFYLFNIKVFKYNSINSNIYVEFRFSL